MQVQTSTGIVIRFQGASQQDLCVLEPIHLLSKISFKNIGKRRQSSSEFWKPVRSQLGPLGPLSAKSQLGPLGPLDPFSAQSN
jgi:hypothetical protein